MNEVRSSNFVISYDPSFVEQHSNSSEFNDSPKAFVSKWGKHVHVTKSCLLRQVENYKGIETPNEVATNDGKCDQTKHLADQKISMERLLNCHNYEEDTKSVYRINSFQSGRSVVIKNTSKFLKTQQMFPGISNMFNAPTKNSGKKFKNSSSDTNDEFYCARCERRRVRRLRRRLYYDMITPRYIIGDYRPPISVGPANELRSSLFYNAKEYRSQFYEYSSSSLSSFDSEIEYNSWQNNDHRYVKNNILKGYVKNISNRKYFKDKKQQCPSRIRHSAPYQVIATPCWEEPKTRNAETNASPRSELPSASSSFWEYVVDKITKKQMKQQNKQVDSDYCCPCKHSQTTDKTPKIPCGAKASQTTANEIDKKHSKVFTGQEKNIAKIDLKPLKELASKACSCECFGTFDTASRDVQLNPKKVDKCDCAVCTSPKLKQPYPKVNVKEECAPSKSRTVKKEKTCQASHEEIKKILKQKYNGEILCIHNPPCILINGCLNLPTTSVKPTTVYPTQLKKGSVYNMYKRMWRQKGKAPENVDSDFAYVPSNVRLPSRSRHAEELKHTFFQNPLCELVRLCSKPKYATDSGNQRATFKRPTNCPPQRPKSSGWPSDVPVYRKRRLLKMIRARH
ncbi:unnamed protein product, partial [Iphiclides podalirius]